MRGLMASGPVGMLVGASLTLGITLLPRLFRRRGKQPTAAEATETQQQTLVFGSPVDAKTGKSNSSTGPATPSGLGKQQRRDVVKGKDQGSNATSSVVPPVVPPLALPTSNAAGSTLDAASIQQQLQMLKNLEDENRRLKEFMNTHMQASQKVQSLEDENKQLKQLQSKLQGDLEDIKARATAPFALTSGDELQSFKQMLATRVPLEARSVCSDFPGLGGGANRDTAASVDGAATVADFAAVRKRAPGFFSELASLLLMAPSPKSHTAQQGNQAQASGVSRMPSALNTPRSTYGGSVLGASSPVPSRQATAPAAGRGSEAGHVDVGQLLESWAGGRL